MEYLIPTDVLREVLRQVGGENEETDQLLRHEIARREAEEAQRALARLS